MPTLPQALSAAGLNRNDFNYLERQSLLSTFAGKQRGGRREVSREGVAELAFFAALQLAGVQPSAARNIVWQWIAELRGGTLTSGIMAIEPQTTRFRPLYANRTLDEAFAAFASAGGFVSSEETTAKELTWRRPQALGLVDVQTIIERVDKLVEAT